MVFARPLADQSVAVALLNTGHFGGPHNITVKFADVSRECNDVMVTGDNDVMFC